MTKAERSVSSNLATFQRTGLRADNCKMVYSPNIGFSKGLVLGHSDCSKADFTMTNNVQNKHNLNLI